jgi:predicted amidohydrolase YtcJ
MEASSGGSERGFRGALPADGADLVLVGGRVLTLDPSRPEVTAVSVAGGRLVAVGDDASVGETAGPGTQVIDLHGRFVCPGFRDSHNHMLRTGLGMLLPSLAGCRTLADVLAIIADAAAATPEGQWVVVNSGWHESALVEGRMPHRHELDVVSPSRPVFLTRGGHNLVLNSVAIGLLGLDADAPAPDGATYEHDARGFTGRIVGIGHVSALAARLPKPSPETYARALALVQQRYAAAGLVSVIDPGLTRAEMDAYRAADDAGALDLRVSMMWRAPEAGTTVDAAVEFLAAGGLTPEHHGDARLKTLGVKIGVDGGVETGFHREPFRRQDDPAHPCGKPLHTLDELTRICRAARAAGLPVGAHVVGDAGVDLALAAYQAAAAEGSLRELRWSLIHMMAARSDHWPVVNDLGIAVAAQQPLMYALAGGFADYLGEDRAADLEPLAAYLSHCRLPVGGGSDSPVAPYEPLLGIASSVTRSTANHGVVGPAWAITPLEALRMYTTGSAWLSFDEKHAGMLRPGMDADVVVLSEDPTTVPGERICDIHVDLTLSGGRVIHDRLDPS